jgi:DNA-binding transcriptional regulator YiaG
MDKQYRDEIGMVMHDTMKDMYEIGAVNDAEMQEFEKKCFVSDDKPIRKPRCVSNKEIAMAMV